MRVPAGDEATVPAVAPTAVPAAMPAAAPRIRYQPRDRDLRGDGALWAVEFGAQDGPPDPRRIRVGLEPLAGTDLMEVWQATGPVSTGRLGAVRYAGDGRFLAGVLELDERDHGSLAAAARAAYEELCRFQAGSGAPHLLRIWNYFGGINRGAGDDERYRQFCLGRAQGFAGYHGARWPAATAIGRPDADPTLQIYWLAGRDPGRPLENPRQVNACLYPRQYGPAAPTFSRAMLVGTRCLLISGTASILGHASHHPGDIARQLQETLDNLASLTRAGSTAAPGLQPRLTGGSLLKIYLREAAAVAEVERLLAPRLPAGLRYLILEAEVCRRELLVEIDCVHGD